MSAHDQLLARVAIEALNAEFSYRIDRGDSLTVAELFSADGIYGRSTGEQSVGRAAIQAAYAKRQQGEVRTVRHIFTNLRLAFDGLDRARGSCILTLFAQDGAPPLYADPFLVADYDDVYVREQGVWRFASRIVTWMFTNRQGKVSPLKLGES